MTEAHYDAEKGSLSINVPKDMVMTLNDAIAHLDETLGDPKREWACDECHKEHEQLRAFLVELRELREAAKRKVYEDDMVQVVPCDECRFNISCGIRRDMTVYCSMTKKYRPLYCAVGERKQKE